MYDVQPKQTQTENEVGERLILELKIISRHKSESDTGKQGRIGALKTFIQRKECARMMQMMHRKCNIADLIQCNFNFLSKILAAHFTISRCIFVCRGTKIEKHWIEYIQKSSFMCICALIKVVQVLRLIRF